MRIESIVILAVTRGFIAYLRFSNPRLDEDLSATSKWGIYERIERALEKKGVNYASL